MVLLIGSVPQVPLKKTGDGIACFIRIRITGCRRIVDALRQKEIHKRVNEAIPIPPKKGAKVSE